MPLFKWQLPEGAAGLWYEVLLP